jgi:hypothetical protein
MCYLHIESLSRWVRVYNFKKGNLYSVLNISENTLPYSGCLSLQALRFEHSCVLCFLENCEGRKLQVPFSFIGLRHVPICRDRLSFI